MAPGYPVKPGGEWATTAALSLRPRGGPVTAPVGGGRAGNPAAGGATTARRLPEPEEDVDAPLERLDRRRGRLRAARRGPRRDREGAADPVPTTPGVVVPLVA
jgi:hypothetical protein